MTSRIQGPGPTREAAAGVAWNRHGGRRRLSVLSAVMALAAGAVLASGCAPSMQGGGPGAAPAEEPADGAIVGISVGAELDILMGLEGRWALPGKTCAQGVGVTLRDGDLIFDAAGEILVFEVGEVTRAGRVDLAVKQPIERAGERHRVVRAGEVLSWSQLAPTLQTRAWRRCAP